MASASSSSHPIDRETLALEGQLGVATIDTDGTLVELGPQLRELIGERADELVGKPHTELFAEGPGLTAIREFAFAALKRGDAFDCQAELATDAGEVEVSASYVPGDDAHTSVLINTGRIPTHHRARAVSIKDAIDLSFAAIEFELDGTIAHANQNFLNAVGYRLDEIVGQHHRIFVPPEYAKSAEYAAFWERLGRGESLTGTFDRIDRHGNRLCLNAAYTPVAGLDGKPRRVIKVCTAVTESVVAQEHLEAGVQRISQVVEAAVEGDLTARTALDGGREVDRIGQLLDSLISRFQAKFGELGLAIERIDGFSQRLDDLSNELVDESATANERASSLTELSATMRQQVETVAASSEELRQSIVEISDSSSSSKEVASSAVETARQTVESVQELGASSEEIGQVIQVINSIASQTNLLALNATIEAARAGSAGAGFAVVAGEVKNLARQTGDATSDISSKINSIQSRTMDAASRIQEICTVVESIFESANSIAGAVEQQAATTQEISTNMVDAAEGSSRLESSSTEIAETASKGAERAQVLGEATQELRSIAETLNASTADLKLS